MATQLCVECGVRPVSEDDPDGRTQLCDKCISDGTCAAYCSPDDDEMMGDGGVCTECGTDWKKWNGEDWELFRKHNRQDGEEEQ